MEEPVLCIEWFKVLHVLSQQMQCGHIHKPSDYCKRELCFGSFGYLNTIDMYRFLFMYTSVIVDVRDVQHMEEQVLCIEWFKVLHVL